VQFCVDICSALFQNQYRRPSSTATATMSGYVGNFEDQRRIERQMKEREAQKKTFEDAKARAEAGAAALRQFGTATSEVML
jgi:hypothetical protein